MVKRGSKVRVRQRGSAKAHLSAFAFRSTCRASYVRWVWSLKWSFRAVRVRLIMDTLVPVPGRRFADAVPVGARQAMPTLRTRSRTSCRSNCGEVVAKIVLCFGTSREANTWPLILLSRRASEAESGDRKERAYSFRVSMRLASSRPIQAATTSYSNRRPTNPHCANPSRAK